MRVCSFKVRAAASPTSPLFCLRGVLGSHMNPTCRSPYFPFVAVVQLGFRSASPDSPQRGPIPSQPTCVAVTQRIATAHISGQYRIALQPTMTQRPASPCLCSSLCLSPFVFSQKLSLGLSSQDSVEDSAVTHVLYNGGREAFGVSSCHLCILLCSRRIFVHVPSLRLEHQCWSFCGPAL